MRPDIEIDKLSDGVSSVQISATDERIEVFTLDTDEDPDLHVECGNKVYLVHNSVLTSQSEFFAAVARSECKEAIEKRIVLEHDYPPDIDRMMSFFYHGTYDDLDLHRKDIGYRDENSSDIAPPSASSGPSSSDAGSDTQTISSPNHGKLSRILTQIHMYALADKYFIPDLKVHAMYEFDKLKSWTPNLTYGPGDIIRAIWSTTPPSDRGLRRNLAYAFASNAWERVNLSVEIEEDLQAAWEEYPEARVDVLEMMLAKQKESCRILEVQVRRGRDYGIHTMIWTPPSEESQTDRNLVRDQLNVVNARINRLQSERDQLRMNYEARKNELGEVNGRLKVAENEVRRLNGIIETLSLSCTAAGNVIQQVTAASAATTLAVGNQAYNSGQGHQGFGVQQVQPAGNGERGYQRDPQSQAPPQSPGHRRNFSTGGIQVQGFHGRHQSDYWR